MAEEINSAFIPPDLYSRPNVVSLATRLNMTPTQQAAFIQGLIAESGGNNPMVATSYATADRSRRNIVAEIATTLQEDDASTIMHAALGRQADANTYKLSGY